MRKFLTLIFVAMLAIAGTVSAQDDMDMDALEFCGDLSAEDCTLYYDAFENTSIPSSSSFDSETSFTFSIDGVQPISASLGLSGSYLVGEPNYDALYSTTLLDFAVADFIDAFDEGLSSFDADLSITVSAPQLAFFVGSESVTLDLYLVDGVGYVDFTPLAFLLGVEGTYGMDIPDVIRFGLESVTIGDIADAIEFALLLAESTGLGLDMGDDMMGDDMAMDPMAQFNSSFQQGLEIGMGLTEEEAIAFAEDVSDLTRLDNAEVDGVDAAVFELRVDLAAFTASELFLEGIEVGLQGQDVPFTAEELQTILVESFNDDSAITFTTFIDEAEGSILRSETSVNFDYDVQAFLAGLGEEFEEGETVEPLVFTLDTFFQRSDVNAVESIELPEGASVVTVQDVLDLLSGGMGEE